MPGERRRERHQEQAEALIPARVYRPRGATSYIQTMTSNRRIEFVARDHPTYSYLGECGGRLSMKRFKATWSPARKSISTLRT
jgi:hypothetical protein